VRAGRSPTQLKHFPAKWEPARRKKMRPANNKKSEFQFRPKGIRSGPLIATPSFASPFRAAAMPARPIHGR
jgi:hypothetical protein